MRRLIVLAVVFMMIFSAVAGVWLTTNVQAKTVGAQTSSARAMATVEMTTGRLLYSKNAHETMPMASTTKIVTAIAVIENIKDLDEPVKIDNKAIGIEGTSIYLQKGESLTVRELLYGLMLRSGNDCAVALAIHVGGSEEKFNEMMLNVARKAGAVNSSFKNAHGLDEEGHLTTAHDLALISAYAMRNPEFAKIAATKDITINGPEYKRPLANKNRLLRSNPDVVGVKTGFTSKAGRCYVGALRDNGMTVICVVLNCGPMFPESENLMESAINEFFMHKILCSQKVITNKKQTVMVAKDFYYPLRQGEVDKIEVKVKDSEITVFLDGKLVHTVPYL